MSTIEQVCAAIVALAGAVTGIISAGDPPPEKLDSAEMPAVYVFTGSAAYDTARYSVTEETRQYRVRVAIAPDGAATPPYLEKRVRTLIPLMRTAFVNAPTLNRVVLQCSVLGDSGVIQLPEYGAVGFEVRLEVLDVVS